MSEPTPIWTPPRAMVEQAEMTAWLRDLELPCPATTRCGPPYAGSESKELGGVVPADPGFRLLPERELVELG